MIDTRAELSDACCNINRADLEGLIGLGIPEAVIPHQIGIASIQPYDSDGLFEPRDDGDRAIVVAADDDLVAFHANDPCRWWRRTGEAQVLGYLPTEPVMPARLFETPLSWLRAGCVGICIVDWRLDPDRLLFCGPIEAETSRLKTRLQNRIIQAAIDRFNIALIESVSHDA